MPFLGAETALGCVGGLFSLSLALVAKTRGFLEEEIPERFWSWFTGSGLQGHALSAPTLYSPTEGKTDPPSRPRLRGFFVETVPKRYTFGTGTPRNWLDLV
jgi:hypothetical protein